MILFLHIGTEKTGSSFLQVVQAKNRHVLQNQGLFFPHAGKWEKEMLAGRISPGNGEELQKALLRKNENRVKFLLRSYRKEAIKVGAKNILISNELLLHGLSVGMSSEVLDRIAMSLGYSQVRYLLILRDPVEQAFSLFLHRAKSGRFSHIKDWLESGYDLPQILLKFLEKIPHQITIRRYKKTGNELMKIYFQDWLDIDTTLLVNEFNRVNPSLSLSELRIIAELRRKRPKLVLPFYQKMVGLSKELKASESELKKAVLFDIQEEIRRSELVWNRFNQLMRPDEQLKISGYKKKVAKGDVLSFSTHQLNAISEFMSDARTFLFKVNLEVNRIRQILARLKGGIIELANIMFK